jgi:hypothetical protein
MAVVLVAICGGLCGIGQLITRYFARDNWVAGVRPIAAPTATATPVPTWTPPNMFIDPQPVLEIRHDLEGRVLKAAG